MGNLNGFNPAEHATEEWTPIPVGEKVLASVNRSRFKDTKNGKGRFLELEFGVIDGEYQGRMLTARLNLENQNPKAVEIANKELARICCALGVDNPNDSADLHDIPLYLEVGQESREFEGKQYTNNIIKKYISRKDHESKTVTVTLSADGTAPSWAGGGK